MKTLGLATLLYRCRPRSKCISFEMKNPVNSVGLVKVVVCLTYSLKPRKFLFVKNILKVSNKGHALGE